MKKRKQSLSHLKAKCSRILQSCAIDMPPAYRLNAPALYTGEPIESASTVEGVQGSL